MWINGLLDTLTLCFFTAIISLFLGTTSAILAWYSNKKWAYYTPLLILTIPPWLLGYQLSDVFGYYNPMLMASISLGIACSVYPHSIILSSLVNRAYNHYEMLQVIKGKNLHSLFLSVYPSLKIGLLPSIAIIFAEVISDFGVSNYFGINTLTMVMYNIWSFSWEFNTLIYGIVLLIGLGLLISRLETENFMSLSSNSTNYTNSFYGILSILPTLTVLLFSIMVSLHWMIMVSVDMNGLFYEFLNSLMLSFTVVFVCIFTIILYVIFPSTKNTMRKIGLLTYSLPGIVIGAIIIYTMGSYIPLIYLLIFAITIRYFGLMVHSISAADRGNEKYFEIVDLFINNNYDKIKYKFKIIMPSLVIGMSLIVLDVLRELPISMILQPMNFTTLALRMNYLSKTEYLPNLGPHSLVMLIVGLIFSLIIIGVIYAKNKTNIN